MAQDSGHKTILVTGGLGFIGSNLVPELRKRGHEVWVCNLGHSEGPNYIRCDVTKYRQLERTFEEHSFDYVYHLAAEYGRWNGEDYYENLWLTNAVGTKNMIRLQENKRFRMIFFSSAEVYGDYDGVMSEDVMDKIPIKQMNDYAMTKWVGELQVLNSADMFGTETVRVRPVNAYGPHEHYSPYRGVIPAFIYKALRGESYTGTNASLTTLRIPAAPSPISLIISSRERYITLVAKRNGSMILNMSPTSSSNIWARMTPRLSIKRRSPSPPGSNTWTSPKRGGI